MSTCSYQILDRFNSERASSLDDIRARERKNLLSSRFYHKCLKTITNRPSLAKLLSYDQYDGYSESEDNQSELCYESETDSSNSHQSHSNSLAQVHPDWYQISDHGDNLDREVSRSLASSPARSTSTIGSSVFLYSSNTSIPAYFFEAPESHFKRSRSNKVNDDPNFPKLNLQSSHESRRRNYKGTTHTTSQSPKPSHSKPDSPGIGLQFYALNNYLAQCNNSGIISETICSRWQILLDALGSTDQHLARDAVLTISHLARERLFQDHTVLHMLQNGLVFSLYNSMWTFEGAHQSIANLLTNLTASTPASLPYLTELMSSSQFMSILQDRITASRSADEIKAIVRFYFSATGTMISQLVQTPNNRLQPLIPDILHRTGITEQALGYYNPLSTLKRFLQPELILELALLLNNRCSDLVDEETVSMSVSILVNVLKLAHLLSSNEIVADHHDWLVEILCGFRESGAEERLREQEEGFASQTRGLRHTVKEKQYDEFSLVFKQLYGLLSSQFEESMRQRPKGYLRNRW